MRRRQLLEIHEQPWCPVAVRDGATDCLRLIATVGRQYRHVLPKLQDALTQSGATRIVDLCAGSGGPWSTLQRQLQGVAGAPVEVLLTDLYPRPLTATPLAGAHLRYLTIPVDATKTPATLAGFRTLFTAFHHFAPHTAQAILQDAVDQGQGIAIFEQTRRNIFGLLFMLVLAPLAFFVTPLIRPWRLARFFWTYLIPAIPLVLAIDGIVSCLRTYTPDEMRAMTSRLTGQPYTWAIGTAPAPLSPLGVTYAIGYPKDDKMTG
jgi:hypothetical protein